ncbi:MAG: hypothetical protein NTY38_26075 [Acidobacteria bacterium]|nr:hypothetical protein [Acidobacteriota bacterium]
MVVDGRPLEPVRIRVSDGNRLAYPGLKVVACPQGGSVSPERATTDSNGTVSFEWSPANAGEALKVLLENGEAIEIRSARDGDSEESPSLRGVGRMTTASR